MPEFCIPCGHVLAGRMKFCAECGARVPAAGDVVTAFVEGDALPEDREDRRYMALSPATSPTDLSILAATPDALIRRSVALNPACPEYLLLILAQDESGVVRQAVAAREDCPEKILEALSRDETFPVRRNVSLNARATAAMVARLTTDEHPLVRDAARSHVRGPQAYDYDAEALALSTAMAAERAESTLSGNAAEAISRLDSIFASDPLGRGSLLGQRAIMESLAYVRSLTAWSRADCEALSDWAWVDEEHLDFDSGAGIVLLWKYTLVLELPWPLCEAHTYWTYYTRIANRLQEDARNHPGPKSGKDVVISIILDLSLLRVEAANLLAIGRLASQVASGFEARRVAEACGDADVYALALVHPKLTTGQVAEVLGSWRITKGGAEWPVTLLDGVFKGKASPISPYSRETVLDAALVDMPERIAPAALRAIASDPRLVAVINTLIPAGTVADYAPDPIQSSWSRGFAKDRTFGEMAAKCSWVRARRAAASWEGAPVALLEVLAIDADPYVRNLVMNHPNVTHKILVLCELGDHS